MTNGIEPYHLWAIFLGEMSVDPDSQGHFIEWVMAHHAERWQAFAAARGKAIDDPDLIIDCAAAGSRALMVALSAELQRLGAIVEAQQIMCGDS